MASFSKDSTARTPFGKNEFLRSTKGLQFESFTLAAASVPAVTIDGESTKIIQPGVALARITSGDDAGKVGPYQPGAVVTESVSLASTATGGTITLTFGGATTSALAFSATAATIQTALEALTTINPGDITVTGGPLNTTPVVITWSGKPGEDVGAITVDNTSATGGTAVATTTAGAHTGAGAATDGRQRADGLVGLNSTFLPWQLTERDVEVSVLYGGAVTQAWCLELNAAGTLFVALSNATRDRLLELPSTNLSFH